MRTPEEDAEDQSWQDFYASLAEEEERRREDDYERSLWE